MRFFKKVNIFLMILLILILQFGAPKDADTDTGKFLYDIPTQLTADYRAAMGLYWSADYESAEIAFQKLQQQDPENAMAYIYLADSQQAQGKRGPASTNYEKAYLILKKKSEQRKKMFPDVKEPEIYSDLVYCLNALKRFDEAKGYGITGMGEGKSADLYVNVAYTYFKLGKTKIAQESFCKSQLTAEPQEINNLTYQRLAALFETGEEWISCPQVITKEKGTNYALIIGVSKYRDSQIPRLKYVDNDARELYRVLTNSRTGIFKPENVTVLLNEKATEKKIMFQLDDMVEKAKKEEDLLLVFYAGHGFTFPNGNTYWLAYDTVYGNQGNRIKSTAVSNLTLATKINDIQAKTVVFFIDACYSSGMVNMSTAVYGLERDLGAAKDYVIITSSQAKQLSLESHALKHGLFSNYLVRGLAGSADTNKDGYVNIDELWNFVNSEVPRHAKKMGKEQNPGRIFSGQTFNLSKNPKF